MTQKNCLFCSIIDRKIKADIVAENEHVLALQDINPMAPTHVLILPKIHFANVGELTEKNQAYFAHMGLMAKELVHSLNVDEDGYRLIINNGANAGQSVFHLHMHFLAGREFSWPPG